jgi:ankyrin repeat protein
MVWVFCTRTRRLQRPRGVVDCLLNAGALPDLPEGERGDCAMVRAVRQGHHGVISRLRHAGARPVDGYAHDEKDGPSKALMKAAINNDESILMQLLREGAEPNTAEADGNTPLSRACENGHLNVVTILLRSGADPCALRRRSVLSKEQRRGAISISSRPF